MLISSEGLLLIYFKFSLIHDGRNKGSGTLYLYQTTPSMHVFVDEEEVTPQSAH